MRGRGLDVFEVKALLADALAEPAAKQWTGEHLLNERAGPRPSPDRPVVA